MLSVVPDALRMNHYVNNSDSKNEVVSSEPKLPESHGKDNLPRDAQMARGYLGLICS